MNTSGEGRNDYIIEANRNGAAFSDYDNDGDLDVLVTSGSTLKRYTNGGDPVVALYENIDGRLFYCRSHTAEFRRGHPLRTLRLYCWDGSSQTCEPAGSILRPGFARASIAPREFERAVQPAD